MERLVEAIVDQVGQLTTPLADIQPLTAPNWYGIKPVGSTRFVGRLKEMWEIHSLLHAGDVAQIVNHLSDKAIDGDAHDPTRLGHPIDRRHGLHVFLKQAQLGPPLRRKQPIQMSYDTSNDLKVVPDGMLDLTQELIRLIRECG